MSKNQKFCAVIKADAYGLGAQKVCKEIDDLVDYFAVSSEEEFMEIMPMSTKPILLLDPVYKNITKLAKFGCEFSVSNWIGFDKMLKQASKNKDVIFKLHLIYNTGMNRFGFKNKIDIAKIFKMVEKTQNISILGVFSHFYQGNHQNFVKRQSELLTDLKQFLAKYFDVSKIIFHISSTDGFELNRDFDMVRIGIGMFCFNNNQVFSLESQIVEFQEVKTKQSVGYNRVFLASSGTRVAIVKIGYADGVFRSIQGKGYFLVNGKFCKVLAVCMDTTIIDVTNVDAKLLDTVTITGKNNDMQIFICDMAKFCDTISYEIMTRISKRVKRVYVGGKTNASNHRKIQSEKTCCRGF